MNVYNILKINIKLIYGDKFMPSSRGSSISPAAAAVNEIRRMALGRRIVFVDAPVAVVVPAAERVAPSTAPVATVLAPLPIAALPKPSLPVAPAA